MKKISIENKPFYVTISAAVITIIFVVSCTWAVAVIKINLENKVENHSDKLTKLENRITKCEQKQEKQDLSMVEITTNLKYIIQLQEEMKKYWMDRSK